MEILKIFGRVVLFGIFTSLCEASFFALPSNWRVVNNASLPNFSTIQGHLRAITDGKGNAIMSEDYRFGFGFININSSGKFILSVVMGVNLSSSSLATEIWTANRERMVADGAVIRLNSNGDLVLEDSDGTVAWSITTGKTQNKAIAMQTTGNLQVYNSTNSSFVSKRSSLVWQSWDHPTHILLPGQVLKVGYSLVSNLSASNTSQGPYRLAMEPGGLVLYYNNTIEQPYWTLGIPRLDFQGILNPCFHGSSSKNAEALYTELKLQVSFNGTVSNFSDSCSNGTNVLDVAPNLNDTLYRFMRLDNDGNLRAYMVPLIPGTSNNAPDWMPEFGIDRSDKCALPRICGPYGICVNGQCSCPCSRTPDVFEELDSFDITKGCFSRSGIPNCSESSGGYHLLPVDGVDYYTNDFLPPLRNVSTIEDCKTMCTSNCSCMAAFFHNSSASCYLANGPLSSLKMKSAFNMTYMAYIKVQNNIPRNVTSESSPLSIGIITGITVGSAAAIIFLCLIIFVLIQQMRKHEVTEKNMVDEEIDEEELQEEAFLKTLPGLPPRFTYHELKEATDNFRKKLGTGGFGSVYEGVLKDNSRVAVKKLDGLRQGYKEFRAEVATIGSISHINLVRLRGFCAHLRQRLLVYELLENRSLDKWLFLPRTASPSSEENSNACLTWEERYNVAVGTARGLTYLHEECRESILHLDIKPQNILLDKNLMPKVADFGMSKLLNEDMTEVVTAVRGTPGYLAPELLKYCIANKKCDVYSFGMVLLELVSGRRNFDPYASDPRLCYFPAWAMLRALEGRYLDLVDKRLENHVDKEGLMRMTKVAFWCIQDNPNKRPSMGFALKILEGEWEIPDAPSCLLQSQSHPVFMEEFGYEPRERGDTEEDPLTGNERRSDSFLIEPSTDLSGPQTTDSSI